MMILTDGAVHVPEDSNFTHMDTLHSTYGEESEPLHGDIMETSWKPT